MSVKTFLMCDMCADIVVMGYHEDTVSTSPVDHQALVNRIDNDVLPSGGYYWESDDLIVDMDYTKLCPGCGVRGVNHEVTADNSTEHY